jgi:hypothetical protein
MTNARNSGRTTTKTGGYCGSPITALAGVSDCPAKLLATAARPIQLNASRRKKFSREEVAGASSCLTLRERAMAGSGKGFGDGTEKRLQLYEVGIDTSSAYLR